MKDEKTNQQAVNQIVSESIILAGGNSTRMGRDKALLPYGGEILLAYLVRKLQDWGMRVTIAAGTEERAAQYRAVLQMSECANGVHFVTDKYVNCGPMAGLHSALCSIPSGFAFVIACDMPFISHSLFVKQIQRMKNDSDIVCIPNQPFHALYHSRVIDRMAAQLEARQLRMMGLLHELNVTNVEPANEEEGLAAFNMNEMRAYQKISENM
ncbi:molybdenum cofactor guanylyltransferase [Paenibacillus xylaniclasticus]|uniref:molybdenum cofactor guanylyltransferase n=1 Tax=Paenibacillus xylaniclasticus TaxID=588083 RepID=UPI000FDABF0D|nr:MULTISPECIES: molybdenum cofactor guanylyltransferase [Paenibacillus]GFN32777.1 hypothetical protein PCURB6_30370 [Paenibacillus curdlanolyticus]